MKIFVLTVSLALLATFFVDAATTPKSEEPIPIVRQESEVNPDGTYHNAWESGNGIKVQEDGSLKMIEDKEVHVVNGNVSWTDLEGNPVLLTYVADENGYHPQGDHLPTSPPIPKSVARALEYIAAHPHVENTVEKKL